MLRPERPFRLRGESYSLLSLRSGVVTELLRMEPEWFPTLIDTTVLKQITRRGNQALNTREEAPRDQRML